MNEQYTSAFTLYDIVGPLHLNVRNVMVLSEEVDGEILERAFNKAMNRYPYMKKRVMTRDEEYFSVDNPLPLVVHELGEEPLPLGSRDVNYHLTSLDYSGNRIGFNMNHTLAGGCGILPWIKTILHTYFSMKYGKDFQVPDLNRPEDVPVPGERDFPQPQDLPDVQSVGMNRMDPGALCIKNALIKYFTDPNPCQYYYFLEVGQKELMSFAHLHDGSPAALCSSFMYRAMLDVFPENEKAIQAFIYHNYRDAVGCPHTTCDLVKGIYITYPESAKNWDIDMLNTVNRGAVIVQSEPENGIIEAKKIWERFRGIEACRTVQEKVKYCTQTPYSENRYPCTYMVSYTGRADWGELLPFIKEKHTLVDSDMILEIAAIGDKFDMVLNQLDDRAEVIEALTREFEKEGITYTLKGPFKKNLPSVRLDF